MNTIKERLRQAEFFSHLPDDDLNRLAKEVEEVRLDTGQSLFEEGDPGDRAYLLVEGELEVVKSGDRREVRLALRRPGDVIGEMALLAGEPRSATVRARSDACLLAIAKTQFDHLVETSAPAARALFSTLLGRWRETQRELRQSERMAQLGTLTAGVAHELNNPAAAIKRAAEQMSPALSLYEETLASSVDQLSGEQFASAVRLSEEWSTGASSLGPLELSDHEAQVEGWLTGHGTEEPWKMAPEVVAAGVFGERLEELDRRFGEAAGPVAWLVAVTGTVRRLLSEMNEGAGRMSAIVSALKSYSFLDQAPVQDVDVMKGLEETLLILSHKLRGVKIEREYAPDLPRITALGSELNQVWTNLIDNAADALTGVDDPRLVVRAYTGERTVVVEIEDNGPGIPAEIQPKVFDAFFTTKPPGFGTGLGLSISYRIIVPEHLGSLTLQSRPGRTVFRVELPVSMDPAPVSPVPPDA